MIIHQIVQLVILNNLVPDIFLSAIKRLITLYFLGEYWVKPFLHEVHYQALPILTLIKCLDFFLSSFPDFFATYNTLVHVIFMRSIFPLCIGCLSFLALCCGIYFRFVWVLLLAIVLRLFRKLSNFHSWWPFVLRTYKTVNGLTSLIGINELLIGPLLHSL